MTRRVIPDYANQLDLFSGAPDEAPVPVTPAISAPPYARPRQQQLDFGTYEPLPLEEDVRSPAARPTPASSGGDGDTAQQPPVQTGIGQQEKTSPDMGTGGRRDSSAGTVLDIEPEEKSSHDFRITSVHRIGQGSLHEKARDNITAIRLLKTLEAENRDATESETPLLARYVGWGGMPNVFGYYPPAEWRDTAAAVTTFSWRLWQSGNSCCEQP